MMDQRGTQCRAQTLLYHIYVGSQKSLLFAIITPENDRFQTDVRQILTVVPVFVPKNAEKR